MSMRPTALQARMSSPARLTLVVSGPDLVRWAVAVGAGAVAWAVAWYLASAKVSYSQQVPFLDLAIGGLILAAIANLGILVRARRAVGARRRALLGEPGATAEVVIEARAAEPGPTSSTLVAGATTTRFHRSDCPLATGRDWPAASREQHEAAGRQPCGLCRP
jgi:hypothetical protein